MRPSRLGAGGSGATLDRTDVRLLFFVPGRQPFVVTVDRHDFNQRIKIVQSVNRLQLGQGRQPARYDYGDIMPDVDVACKLDTTSAARARNAESLAASEKPKCNDTISSRSWMMVATSSICPTI